MFVGWHRDGRPALVPDDSESNRGKSRNSDCASTGRCQVDYAPSDEWASIRDTNDDLLAVSLVDDGDAGPERQRPVRCCQGARVQPPAVGGPAPSVTITIPVHRGNSSLWTGPSRRRKRDGRDANRQAKEQRLANLHLKPHMLLGSNHCNSASADRGHQLGNCGHCAAESEDANNKFGRTSYPR